jgi:hypothetical protein
MISENARACWSAAVLCIVSSGCGSTQQPAAPAASTVQSTEGGEPAPEQKPPATVEEEHQRVKLRFEDPRHQEILGHTAYAAVQAGEEKVVAELMHTLFVDMKSSGSFDIDASVKAAGGIEPYKARIASYLTSEDVMARGTAALALAIAGDLKYVDPLVTLLRSKNLRAHLESLEGYDRGMAMMALALLKATSYRAEIEAFKSSQLKNESEGATAALELMDH